MYNFRCRTRIAGGFMIRDYVANQSKDNKKMHVYALKGVYMHLHGTALLFRDIFIMSYYIEKVQY